MVRVYRRALAAMSATSAIASPVFPAFAATSSQGSGSDPAQKFGVSIGAGSSLNIPGQGVLSFNTGLLIEGSVNAELSCTQPGPGTCVRIAEGGTLEGDITCAETVEIHGKLLGNIECSYLTITEGAEIVGDIICGSLVIEPGGTVVGFVRSGASVTGTELEVVRPADAASTSRGHSYNQHKLKRRCSPIERWAGEACDRKPDPKRENTPDSDESQRSAAPVPSDPQLIGAEGDHKYQQSGSAVSSGGGMQPIQAEGKTDFLPVDLSEFGGTNTTAEGGSLSNPPTLKGNVERSARAAVVGEQFFVDDFGNPLYRGATPAEEDSLRENFNLVRHTRALMDSTIHERERRSRKAARDALINARRDRQAIKPGDEQVD